MAAGAALVMGLTGCTGGGATGGVSSSTPAATGTPGQGTAAVSGSIQVKGSDTMVNLGQAWAQAFSQKNPGVNISVTGGGTGTGMAALINKTTDIAQASREITPVELAAATKNGVNPVATKVALDGIVVAVNPANTVGELDFKQLSDIYTAKVTDWKQLGGKPGKIVLLSRESNSGTYSFFLQNVVQSQGKTLKYAASALLLPSSQAIADQVAQNPNAVGYFGMGYESPKIKVVAVKKSASDRAVKPSIATVQDSSYPISRPLLDYTNGQPQGAAKALIDFELSPDGQGVVKQMDFVPLPK